MFLFCILTYAPFLRICARAYSFAKSFLGVQKPFFSNKVISPRWHGFKSEPLGSSWTSNGDGTSRRGEKFRPWGRQLQPFIVLGRSVVYQLCLIFKSEAFWVAGSFIADPTLYLDVSGLSYD